MGLRYAVNTHRNRWVFLRSFGIIYILEEIIMNKMKNLIQKHERVWFYLKDLETKRKFVQEANAMGCWYLNGEPITLDNCYHIMALHSGCRLAQVKIYIWNASFDGAVITLPPLRVDYAKFAADEEDWECTRSSFETIQLPMSMTKN